MAEIAGATLTPTLPTIKGRAKIHGHTNIDVQLGGNSFTEHVAWGQDPDVRADATTTQAPPAHTSSVAYSAGAATTYSGPTGMQTGSPSSTYSGTGGGAGAVTSAGTGAPAATSIGAPMHQEHSMRQGTLLHRHTRLILPTIPTVTVLRRMEKYLSLSPMGIPCTLPMRPLLPP